MFASWKHTERTETKQAWENKWSMWLDCAGHVFIYKHVFIYM